MGELEDELGKVVALLRCDRCGEWPAGYDTETGAILCEGCVPVKRAFLALVRQSLANAELVVIDHAAEA